MKTRFLVAVGFGAAVIATASIVTGGDANAQTGPVEASPVVTSQDLGSGGVTGSLQLPGSEFSIRVSQGSQDPRTWIGEVQDGMINVAQIITGTAIHGTPGIRRVLCAQAWGSGERFNAGGFDSNGRANFSIPNSAFNAPYRAYTLSLGINGCETVNYLEWNSVTVNGGQKVLASQVQGDGAMDRTKTPFFGVLFTVTDGALSATNPHGAVGVRQLPATNAGLFTVPSMSITQDATAGTATVRFSTALPQGTVLHFFRGFEPEDMSVGGMTEVTVPMRLLATTGGFTLYQPQAPGFPGAWADWVAFQPSQLTANSQFVLVKDEDGAWGIKYVPYAGQGPNR